MRPDLTLSVLVPVYNERLTLRTLVDRVRAVPIRKEIILVDDASTDGTTEVVRQLGQEGADDPDNRIVVVFHPQNAGKGAAIRTAMQHVRGDVALIQDADLEYDPAEYPTLIQPILDGHADVVYGSRFLGGPHRVLFFYHSIGNGFLTLLSNLFTDLNLTDMETCYKVFRADVLQRLHLTSNRFGIEPEITAKVARLGCRIYEVPVSYHGREYWEGKKIGWKDGVAAIWTIVRHGLFDDPAHDDPGYTTLRRLRPARRYHEWLWSQFAPAVGDRVLELDGGVGSFTDFLRNRDRVVVTEHNPQYLALLRSRFRHHPNVTVLDVDWQQPDLTALRGERFDTIICRNVLERLSDDGAALATLAGLLAPGGHLLLQAPAMPELYGSIDRTLGHHRRYAREALTAQLAAHGLSAEDARYINLPGALAWYVYARLLGRSRTPSVQGRVNSLLVPWLRLERRLAPGRGTSLLVMARRAAAGELPQRHNDTTTQRESA
jgi:glycosyltransferase involved in cell wall biosynthesis